jgi:hypothetical protein
MAEKGGYHGHPIDCVYSANKMSNGRCLFLSKKLYSIAVAFFWKNLLDGKEIWAIPRPFTPQKESAVLQV